MSIRHRNRLTLWFETNRHPRWTLAIVAALLYGPSLGGGFVIDDYRCLRLLQAHAQGDPQPPYDPGALDPIGLYRFLAGGDDNRQARLDGWYPWWLQDEVRYQHLRPLAERLIRTEYAVFGDRATGYHLVSLCLYIIGVWLALALFRRITPEERVARWAAMLFAVASGHAITVVFISSQCDLLALNLIAGAALVSIRFMEAGRIRWLVPAAVMLLLALGSKEASLAAVVLPLCLAIALPSAPGLWKRAAICSGALTAIGLLWLVYYSSHGYGANTALMLDPIKAPLDYLTALPGRAIVLLSTWLIPLNPFLFYFRPGLHVGLYVYGAIGAVALFLVGRMLWRKSPSPRGCAAMAIWVVPFLPLLVCTSPDDRVMMLPSIGLAFLGAAWLTRPRSDGSARLAKLPFILLFVIQISTTWTVMAAMRFMENVATGAARATLSSAKLDTANGNPAIRTASISTSSVPRCVFLLNAPISLQPLFAQESACRLTGDTDVRFAYLSDARDPRLTVTGERSLRLETQDEPLLAGFMGLMGRTRERHYQAGDTFDAGEFTARIVSADASGVRAVEFTFLQPLMSEAYSFYRCTPDGEPERILLDARSEIQATGTREPPPPSG